MPSVHEKCQQGRDARADAREEGRSYIRSTRGADGDMRQDCVINTHADAADATRRRELGSRFKYYSRLASRQFISFLDFGEAQRRAHTAEVRAQG